MPDGSMILPKPVPAFERLRRHAGDARSLDRLRHHYRIEVDLARQLMESSREERLTAYGRLYDELFRLVPDHPQMTGKTGGASYVPRQLRWVSRLVTPQTRFVEIGGGDCRLSIAVADRAAEAIGVDVTDALVAESGLPANFRFLRTDGLTLDLPDASVDLVYSNQLIEHLHPDDAAAQLGEIFRVLAPGGRYACITPNRATGPHDVSRYFSPVARGFHLKEYTFADLHAAFRAAGFGRIAFSCALAGRHLFTTPTPIARWAERLAMALPERWRPVLGRSLPLRALLTIRSVATKPG